MSRQNPDTSKHSRDHDHEGEHGRARAAACHQFRAATAAADGWPAGPLARIWKRDAADHPRAAVAADLRVAAEASSAVASGDWPHGRAAALYQGGG